MSVPSRILFLVFLLVVPPDRFFAADQAPATRTDLMFALNTAVKERDPERILACFNFDRADDSMKRTIETAVQKICQWPTSHVFASERSGTGPLETTRDGRTWHLNGDWEFQVHIFMRKDQPSKGYVFPAGRTPRGMAILLLVEKSRTGGN
jgi:hypothetical protein